MMLRSSASALLLTSLLCIPSPAENKPEERVVQLCVATPMNLSQRLVDTKWARNMLMRELKFERKHKHAPIVSALKAGKLKILKDKNATSLYSIQGGFVEVMNNKATVLVEGVKES